MSCLHSASVLCSGKFVVAYFLFDTEKTFAKMVSRFDGKNIVVTGAGQGTNKYYFFFFLIQNNLNYIEPASLRCSHNLICKFSM